MTIKPNFLKTLITALLIVIPLYPKFPTFRIPGIYVAIRLEDFLILFVLVVFLIPLLSNIKYFLKDKISKSIILFLSIGLISTISAVLVTNSASTSIALLHLFRRVEYFSLFFVGILYMKQELDSNAFISYVFRLLIVINFVILIYGLGQYYFNLPIITTQNQEYSKGVALSWVPGAHINSTFAGHYDLASYLVLTAPMFVALFFTLKDKISKIFFATVLASSFWLFSVAVSRISILAFLVSTTVSLFLLKKYKEILVIGLISAIAFGFSPDLRARYESIINVLKDKISSLIVVYADEGVVEDRSTSIRLQVEWPRAIRAFNKNPILGTGYSSITLATDNDYLRLLGELGTLGLVSFLLIFVNLYRYIKKYRFDGSLESVFVACFVGSTIGILITAVFIDIFEASKFATMYWLFAGLAIGIVTKKKYE